MKAKFVAALLLLLLLPSPALAYSYFSFSGFGFGLGYSSYGYGFGYGFSAGFGYGYGGGNSGCGNCNYSGTPNLIVGFGANTNKSDYTVGPASFSTPVMTARTHERAIGLVQREARNVMKRSCNEAGTQGGTILVNNRLRPLRLIYLVEAMDVAVGRDGRNFSATANVTFSCILK